MYVDLSLVELQRRFRSHYSLLPAPHCFVVVVVFFLFIKVMFIYFKPISVHSHRLHACSVSSFYLEALFCSVLFSASTYKLELHI